MRIRKGDIVKIREDRLMKAYHYLKDRKYIVKNLQRRGIETYAILEPNNYINIKALEKINNKRR